MNIYARIRKIEDEQYFKRLVNSILGAHYTEDFQPTKDWHDFGVDGYLHSSKTVYAVYCPRYPERAEQHQYKDKITKDIRRLKTALENRAVELKVENWTLVTPDDISMEVLQHIQEQVEDYKWGHHALTAQILAPLFMMYPRIHLDFPEITAGIQFDKIPSIDARLGKNREYVMLEIFNDGTEDIKNLEVKIKRPGEDWQVCTHDFYYEFDDPVRRYPHSCFNLRTGERQFLSNVPSKGGFGVRITGVGVESEKVFSKEWAIPEHNFILP